MSGRNKKEDIILKVYTSRKSYVPFYFMILFLGALIIYLYFGGYAINLFMLIVFGVFTFLVINLTETHRMSSSYSITPNDITCKYGIFNKKVIKLDYLAISNLDFDQNLWQWIWGYGDVNIRLFSKENRVELKNINRPSEFARMVEKIRGENR